MYKPVVLVVLDGFGLSKATIGNAIVQAKLPTFEKLDNFYPQTALQASGISAGLPWEEMGNSEVGHIILGAGRIIYQNLPRISLAIEDRSFFKNEALLKAIAHAKENNSSLHLVGLVSNGAVHSHLDHLFALLELAKENGISQVFIHAITDGRDTPPKSAVEFIEKVEDFTKRNEIGKIATIAGRYWSMDRNNNWDRIQTAYENMTSAKFQTGFTPSEYLEQSYNKEELDEFIRPACFDLQGIVKDNDAVIFFNFREDRARQLTKAFILPGFDKFLREQLKNLEFVTMTMYEEDLPVDIAFSPIEITNTFGEVLSASGKKQLRIAETEKYAHVTYFFNGGREEPLRGETRILVPSKAVQTYAKVPEMSAPEITQKVEEAIEKNEYDFILINYANPDMVGHTGNLKAAIQAVEFLDSMLDKVIRKTISSGGCLLITADHGNCEAMFNHKIGEVDTQHSTNPVPLWFVTAQNHRQKTAEEIEREKFEIKGLLSDIAPTILEIMEIQKPAEMTGESLLNILK